MSNDTCPNKGQRNIARALEMGQRIKLGWQTCVVCGARIFVEQQKDGWAFYPPHEKPR